MDNEGNKLPAKITAEGNVEEEEKVDEEVYGRNMEYEEPASIVRKGWP